MAHRIPTMSARGCMTHRTDPAHPRDRAAVPSLSARAHRLASRLAAAEAAERRRSIGWGPTGPGPDDGPASTRAASRARLLIAFHATLDRLHEADGFDEALGAFRAYKAHLVRRLSDRS